MPLRPALDALAPGAAGPPGNTQAALVAARPKRRRTQWARWPTWLGAAFVATLVFTLTDLLNPDWFGYQVIFQEQGGWLSDQGRDPLFVAICRFGAWVFGAEAYDEFRQAVGVYFVVFTALLCSGRVLVRPPAPLRQQWRDGFALLLLVVLFTSTRFAVQIREGLAMTLLLFGLRHCQLAPRKFAIALAWFGAAVLTHAGTAPLMLALTLAMFLAARSRRSRRDFARQIARLAPAALALGGAVAWIVLNISSSTSLVDDLYGDIASTSSGWQAKVVYWSVMGLAAWVVAREALRAHADQDTPPVLRNFVAVLGCWLLPGVYALIVGLLLGAGPLTAVSGSARLLQMVLALLILMVVMRGRSRWSLLAVTALLAADQIRVFSESLITTYSAAA
jgi:hypothetical protein